ncbi:MAG TPA: TIGR00730 family Rossman fold protein [Anaerolineaceae bacterium]|nr:TIGR00730 family Rossman fold protein [Anaerolineaceae bacterium]
MNPLQSICVYAASADSLRPEYYAAAAALGRLLAGRGIALIYGAGRTGLMGAVAEGALQGGGQVIGVTPEHFNTPVLIHQGLTRLEVVESMHVRKARMSALADAFIALPGGLGTFEELFETLTWAQVGLHQKPIGLLNTLGYYDPLLALIGHARAEGFIYSEHERLLVADPDPAGLLDQLQDFQRPAGMERWMERE